jgi:hypothetical protein
MRRVLAVLAAVVLSCGAARAEADARETAAASLRENVEALMREWSEDLAYAYLDSWSSKNETALAAVAEMYGRNVSFFGRSVARDAVHREKRAFARRWPVRRYEHRPETLTIECAASRKACLVRSVIDWTAEDPRRGARAAGTARFELGIGFAGAKPEVLHESGEVLRDGAPSARTAEDGRRWAWASLVLDQ